MKLSSLNHRFLVLTGMLFVSLVTTLFPLISLAESPTNSESIGQQALEKEIEQFIRNHPEVLMESLQAFEIRRKEEAKLQAKWLVTTRQNELVNDPTSPVSGNLDGGVVLVEFYDYRCSFCKRVASAVTKLQKEDSRVRVVYKDLPILGEVSEIVARAALASKVQGKHQIFHEALLASNGDLTREKILNIAGSVGIDSKRLEADMDAPEWQTVIERNRLLARDLGITGTPGFVVGTEVVSGALDLKELKKLIELGVSSK